MPTQAHPYHADKAYRLANLTLIAEAQSLWEADNPNADELEDIFAMPRSYYDELFLGAYDASAQRLYDDLHDTVAEQYDLIAALRIGTDIIPDFEEIADTDPDTIDNLETVWTLMQSYSKRLNESLANSVRYGFSKLLMGFVLRAKDDSHAVFVLRGTMNMQEWLNNMNYRLVGFHPLDKQWGRVHNGFRDIYKGLRGQIRQQVSELPSAMPLYFAGHSLGAAVAQLAALDIAIAHGARGDQLQVYGFAPPRVGDADFVEAYNTHVGTSYRVLNVCDVVPYLPSARVDTYMDLTERPYADTKGPLTYVHQMGNPIDNHVVSYHLATLHEIPSEDADYSQVE